MRGLFRPARIFWLLGLGLLIGTVAGAGWMLNHSEAGDNPADNEYSVTVPFGGHGIVCFGYVDVLPGVTKIYPLQAGRVEWVIEEGESVEKGKELLRLESPAAAADWERAKLALEDAKLVLEEAQRLTQKHELEIESQQLAIQAAEAEKKAAKKQVEKLEDLRKKGLKGNEFDIDAGKEQLKKMDALIEVEQKKLAILKLFGPQDKIKRADLDVKLKEQQVKKARVALDEHTLLAPTDGHVLRIFTSKGETIGGPSPKTPAIEFCPKLPRIIRAEVLQEWAHRLKAGQEAIIEDDTTAAHQWKGKVVRISDWFTHRRSIIQEPFQFNDVRTVECIIEITAEPPGQKLRIGQRMRVMINQGGP